MPENDVDDSTLGIDVYGCNDNTGSNVDNKSKKKCSAGFRRNALALEIGLSNLSNNMTAKKAQHTLMNTIYINVIIIIGKYYRKYKIHT